MILPPLLRLLGRNCNRVAQREDQLSRFLREDNLIHVHISAYKPSLQCFI